MRGGRRRRGEVVVPLQVVVQVRVVLQAVVGGGEAVALLRGGVRAPAKGRKQKRGKWK